MVIFFFFLLFSKTNCKTFPLPMIVKGGKSTSQSVCAGFSCCATLTSSPVTAVQAVQGSDCHNALMTRPVSEEQTDLQTHGDCQTCLHWFGNMTLCPNGSITLLIDHYRKPQEEHLLFLGALKTFLPILFTCTDRNIWQESILEKQLMVLQLFFKHPSEPIEFLRKFQF